MPHGAPTEPLEGLLVLGRSTLSASGEKPTQGCQRSPASCPPGKRKLCPRAEKGWQSCSGAVLCPLEQHRGSTLGRSRATVYWATTQRSWACAAGRELPPWQMDLIFRGGSVWGQQLTLVGATPKDYSQLYALESFLVLSPEHAVPRMEPRSELEVSRALALHTADPGPVLASCMCL